jgi:putative transposon-encoded protein
VPGTEKARFEIFGAELMEKQVAASGKSGRVYLPAHWLGKKVKIIRVD